MFSKRLKNHLVSLVLFNQELIVMKNLKLYSIVNIVCTLVAFPIILGYCNESLLVGLSVIYSALAVALLPYCFNNKFSSKKAEKRVLICANITILVAIIVGVIEYCLHTSLMVRIITVSCIVFLGGLKFISLLIKHSSSDF